MRRRRYDFTGGLSFYGMRSKSDEPLWKQILVMLGYTAISVFLAGLCVYYFGYHTMLTDNAMGLDNVKGQEVLVDRLLYRLNDPRAEDVIAFYPGGSTLMHPLVRRVVAVPGDTVEIRDNVLLVNGIPYALDSNLAMISYAGIAQNALRLKTDEYFCMGDFPGEGEDSRYPTIGPVTENAIIGRVWYAKYYKGEEGTSWGHFVH